MNARLQLMLLRGAEAPAPVAPKPAPAPAPMRLLGEGLDAIIQHTRRKPWGWERLVFPYGIDDPALPNQPTAIDRLLRYRTAAQLHPAEPDPLKAGQREALGTLYRNAWERGERPNFRRIGRLMPVPLGRRARQAVPA